MSDEFKKALGKHQALFGVELSDETIGRLTEYYTAILEHNPLLHLVGPCPPGEFATRHILESLTLLDHLPDDANFADVGTGAGLPAIPCLLVREDLRATLIESKEKKTEFLKHAIAHLDLQGRVTVVNKQFSETEPGGAQFITCRALDKFSEKLPSLIRWAGRRHMHLFGGRDLENKLKELSPIYEKRLLPLSEKRFLFSIRASPGQPGAD